MLFAVVAGRGKPAFDAARGAIPDTGAQVEKALARLRERLKGRLPPTRMVLKPTMVKRIKKRRRYAMSYAFKAEFVKRTTYRDEDGSLQTSPPRRIAAKQRRELLHFLHGISPEERHFTLELAADGEWHSTETA